MVNIFRTGSIKLKTARRVVMIGALAALSACSPSGALFDIGSPVSGSECEERTARQLAGVDFASAPMVEMTIRRNEFSPMIVRLTKGRAYVFRLRNRDDEVHAFNAPAFFDNIAVAAAALDNDILPGRCPGPIVEVQSGQSFEMQFLAANDGVYEYRDTGSAGSWLGNFLNTAPPGGIIRIEESY